MQSVLNKARLIGRNVLIPNFIVINLPTNDYLTVMSHRHANGDPTGDFTTIDKNLLSKKALFKLGIPKD